MPTSKTALRDPFAHPALTDAVRALARRGQVYSYRKHTVLIQEGDVGDTIYIILSGRLQAFANNADGNRQFTYNEYGPGEYVGEMGLDGGARSASVKALEASVCAVITRPTLEAHLAEQPTFAFELLAKVIRRARAATMSAKQMALNDVYGRLKMLLHEMAEPHPAGGSVTRERFTHQEFADRLGCGREMISRVLKDLESGGYITVEPDRRLQWRQLPARW